MSFAQNFKEARNKTGLSQEELARKLHISRQAISRYENGTAEPSIDMLNEISTIFEMPVELLIGSKKEIPEYKEFDALLKDDKKLLFYDFIKQHKWYMYFLPIILMLSMNSGIGIASYAFIRFLNIGVSSASYILLLIGAVLIIIAAIYLLINNSLVVSRMFNKWLRDYNGLIRRKKLMII